jgi:uncharacterized protein (TIGR03437 family)
MSRIVIASLSVLFLIPQGLRAAGATGAITITNPGFETIPSNPGWISCVGNGGPGSGGAGCQDTLNGIVPGWTASNTTSIGLFQPGPNYFTVPMPAAEGQTLAQVSSGTLSQVLSATLQVSTVYTLQVDVGRRLDNLYPSPPPTALLFAGNTQIASATGAQPALGGWTTWTGTYTSSASDPLAGQALKIVLGVTTPQGDFDNVRLTAAQTGGTACTYSLSPTSASPGAAQTSGTITVTAGTGCTWTAASNASTWITITGGASGTGNGTVSYTVATNTSTSSRTGTITVGGQTFTVTQAGASVTCSYALSASSATAAAGGGSGSFSVTAGAGCAWSATSGVNWITTTSSGSGNGTVNYTVAANTSTSSRTGAIAVGGQAFQVSQAGAMAPGGPAIGTGGVVSAADYSADLAPGALISIFGKNLAPSTLQASKTPLPTTLNGTSVQISGTGGTAQLPLVFVSTGQINAQLPFAITGQAQVTVTTAAGTSAPAPVTILPVAPKLFTLTMDGKGEPIVLHANYTVVSSQSPAQAGEVVIVYLTGLGAVTPSLDAGAPAGDGSDAYPINYVQADVGVTVNGEPTSVQFAGLAPYFVGLYQLNVQLPATLLPGANAFYVVSGQQASQDGVAMAINSNWKMVGSGTVAAAGGQISGTGISVSVPSGAVTTSQGISVYANTSPPPASADPWRVSEVYSISGLPATTGAPITITMDLTPGAAATGEIYVHVERTDDLEGSILVPATVSNGRVTAAIPAMTSTGADSTSTGAGSSATGADSAATAHSQQAAGATSNVTPTFTLWSLAGYHSLYSARNLFLITAPVSDAIQGGAEEMADQLEKTYDYIEQQLGLPWKTGTHNRNFPITVNIEVFTGARAQRWGEEGSTRLGVRNQCLNLNAIFLQDSKNFVQMRLTASHELFHLMQNLWDPSSAPSTWLWMEEAMSTWMEKRMATDASYVPPTVHGTASVPGSTSDNYGFLTVHGLEFPPSGYGLLSGPGNTGDVQEHGYGASQFLEFLTNKYGIKFVTQLVQTMAVRAPGLFGSSSYSPVAAINSLSTQVGVDWRLFCENFMDGRVYSTPYGFPSAADIQGLSNGSYYFDKSADTGITFSKAFPDLSAQIYNIGIHQPGWPQNTTLSLQLNDPTGDAEAIAYLHRSGSFSKLAIFKNSYDIKNAETLQGAGLVIMVANGHAAAPYTGTTQISFTVKTGASLPVLKRVVAELTPILCTQTRYTTSGTVESTRIGMPCGMSLTNNPYDINFTGFRTLTWNGNSFSASGRVLGANAGDYWDVDISGQIDTSATPMTIKTARFSSAAHYVDSLKETIDGSEEFTVSNVPLLGANYYGYTLDFGQTGNAIAGEVSGIKATSTWKNPDGSLFMRYDYDSTRTDWSNGTLSIGFSSGCVGVACP